MTDNPITYLAYGYPGEELCAMFFPTREEAQKWMAEVLPGHYRLMAVQGVDYENLRVLTVDDYPAAPAAKKKWGFRR